MSPQIVCVCGTDQFEAQVVASPLPVFINFSSTRSQRPSGVVAPLLRKLAGDTAGKLRLVEIDSDDPANEQVKSWHPLPCVPGFFFEVQGTIAYRFVGVSDYAGFRAHCDAGLQAAGISIAAPTAAEMQFAATAARLWQEFMGEEIRVPSAQAYDAYVSRLETAVDSYLNDDKRRAPAGIVSGAVCRIGDPFCR